MLDHGKIASMNGQVDRRRLLVVQVSELERVFSMLDADVNGLLMTGPPVALDELYHEQSRAQAALSDQASLLQVCLPGS